MIGSVNLEELKARKYVEEEVLLCTTYGKNTVDVLEAKITELQNWKDHIFNKIPDDGEKGITVHWVISEKSIHGNNSIKAQLMARGFEEGEGSSIRRDSPTCMKESLRLTLVTAASKGWRIGSLDIKAAFLQGQKIKQDVYLKCPKKAGTDKLQKLNKTVYGLGYVSRRRYDKSDFVNHYLDLEEKREKGEEFVMC